MAQAMGETLGQAVSDVSAPDVDAIVSTAANQGYDLGQMLGQLKALAEK